MGREVIYSLMDFDPKRFSFDPVVAEFNAKYASTYCYINGELQLVFELNYDYLKGSANSYSIMDIVSIEPFLPKAGLYLGKDGQLLYLYKLAKKQWKRSFQLYENYEYIIHQAGKENTLTTITQGKYYEESLYHKGNVYVRWHLVGIEHETGYLGISEQYKALMPELKVWYGNLIKLQSELLKSTKKEQKKYTHKPLFSDNVVQELANQYYNIDLNNIHIAMNPIQAVENIEDEAEDIH